MTKLEDPKCPKCFSSMILRMAQKGSNSGNSFWGCSKFPRCRGTKAYQGNEVQTESKTIAMKPNPKTIETPPPLPEKRTELSEIQKNQLIKLRDRLLNLTSRNRSIKLSRIDAKWGFDLSSLNELNTKLANDVVSFCLKKEGEIALLPKAKNEKEAEKIASLYNKLVHLDRSINEIHREKGLHDLYLGFPFLSGIPHGSGTVIQAPIFLIPVKLEKKSPLKGQSNWYISVSKDNPAIFNKTLFLALSKMCDLKVNHSLFEEEIPDELYGEKSLIDKIHSLLNDYGVISHISENANDDVFDPVQQFKTNEVKDLFVDGKLHIKQHAVLGHFPQADSSIQKDYDSMLKMSQEELSGILSFIEDPLEIEDTNEKSISNFGESSGEDFEKRTIDERRENENFFFLQSDSSQDRILLALSNIENKGIVIWGPPGTGKSQTIVNIIGDCLSKGKTVLVVSQKRAALDVVYDRIGTKSSENLLGLVHDAKNDRKQFYKKISQEINEIKNGPARQKIQDPSLEIESITKTLKDLTIAYSDNTYGIPLGELYRQLKSGINTEFVIDPVWRNSNKDELEKTAYALDSMQSHGSVLSKTKFDSARKPFVNVTFENISSAIQISQEVVEGSFYQESRAIVDRNFAGHVNTSPRVESFRSVHFEYESYKSFFRYLTPRWWSLASNIKKQSNEAIEYFKDVSLKLRMNISQVVDERIADELSLAVAKGRVVEPEVLNFLRFTAAEFFRIKGFDHDYNKLSDIHKKLVLDFDKATLEGKISSSDRWGDTFRKAVYQCWILELEKKHPVIAQIRSGRVEELRLRLKELLDIKIEYSVQELKKRSREGLFNSKTLSDIEKEIGKRTAPSIRKLNEKYIGKSDFVKLLPVWLSSPESVSDMFPLTKGLFDVVIFDEASQCTVENGLTAIYRGKQIIIAGDEKQLPPSRFFESSTETDDETEDETTFATIEPSLLTLAKKNLKYQSHMLEWHYRSKSQELITFSNQQFYEGRMKIAPNVIPFMKGNRPAIEWHSVKGYWENRCNEIEANVVVARLKHYLSFENPPTVGIITFNLQQKEMIQDRIDEAIVDDPEFAALIDIDKNRKDHQGNELDIQYFVKNIENVQGDERDIIIFSIGYAPMSEGGRVYQRFGPLGTAGGENRLNVAITRAIRKIDIVCSIDPEKDINTSTSKNIGPKVFQQYLCFAKAVASSDIDKANRILKEINPNLKSQGSGKTAHFDSPFEEEVFNDLTRLGYEVHTQVGQSGFRIDLAIVHPGNSDRYILGIECDGAMFHSALSIRERDVFRQRFLETRGWAIHRIWSSNWWANKEQELKKIQLLMEKLKRERK